MDKILLERHVMEIGMDEVNQKKALGLSFLEKNEIAEAIKVYQQILLDYPDDVESYLLLGDLYLAKEDFPASAKLYQKALTLDPENTVIQRRLKLASFELSAHSSEEIPTDIKSVSRLLQEISGRKNPIDEEEINNAARLLDQIVHASNPAVVVANNLENIDALLPALLELNIRQAKNDRRFDLVNLLQTLQENIAAMINNPEETINVAATSEKLDVNKQDFKIKHAVILVSEPESLSSRAKVLIQALESTGCQVILQRFSEPDDNETPDLLITFNPHVYPELIEKMASYSARNVPILLDLDDDFEYMPISHPDYTSFGLGSLEKSRSYNAALLFANLITVPGEAFAAHIREGGFNVAVLPFGWSSSNAQWQKESARRSTVNIGIIGIHGNFEDVQQHRRIIVRLLREFPQTRLFICGDPMTYKMFENVSENRRVFLPRVPDEDMSYILGQLDILTIPLNSTPYHLVSTDKFLMQAGVKGIPWIASPMPDFIQWRTGGVTADKPDEWHSYLRQFVQDRDLRSTLGTAGRKQSLQREDAEISKMWVKILQSLPANKKSKSVSKK